MQQCWDNDPVKRPTASYLNEKLGEWIILICDDPTPSKISDENSIAEEKRWKMISQLSKKITHPDLQLFRFLIITILMPHYVHSSVEPRPNRTQFIIPARIEVLGPINEFTRFHEIHSEFI
ncbi:unnamed protein product [Rhizophagus irregularis]|nr:unnamed protein product [Rhizophagus irregularis]